MRLESKAAIVRVPKIPLLGIRFSNCIPMVEDPINARNAAAVDTRTDDELAPVIDSERGAALRFGSSGGYKIDWLRFCFAPRRIEEGNVKAFATLALPVVRIQSSQRLTRKKLPIFIVFFLVASNVD